jgi:hypothetical protein
MDILPSSLPGELTELAIVGDAFRGIHTMGAGNHFYECVPCMLPYLENWQSWVSFACLIPEKLAMIGILYMPFLENWRTLRAGNHGRTHRYREQNMLPYLGNWQSWGCPACSLPGELAIMGMPCMLLTWRTGNHRDALHASVP